MKNKTITFLNPKETETIARLSYEKVRVVTLAQVRSWLKYPPGVLARTIARLQNKGILRVIKKGIYYYSPIENGPSGSTLNEYIIPPILFPKSCYYVGYTNMFNYYGFLEQIPQTMYILNASIQHQKIIGKTTYKLLKVPSSRIYGVEKLTIQGSEVFVSDRERTLVDLIYFPAPVGGLKKAFEILQSQSKNHKTDLNKLIRYAVQFPGIATRKRIGYVLEQGGVSPTKLKPLMRSVAKTSLTTLFGSKSRKGTINQTWKVIIDVA